MVKLSVVVGALMACSASAFAPSARSASFVTSLQAAAAPEVDSVGNNLIVKNFLENIESSGLLTDVANSGLLSSAAESGITLSGIESLLKEAASNKDLLIFAEAASPEVLPLLPKVVDLAPPALPLLAAAVKISPGTLQGLALVSVAAAAAAVSVIPDDSTLNVAIQTLIVGALGVAAPAASIIGAGVLSKIKA